MFPEKLKRLKSWLLELNLPPFLHKLLAQWLSASFMRYLLIGFSSFFIQVALLYLFTGPLGFDKFSGNISSTLLSMVFNFLMSNFWTFKSGSTGQGKKLGKYITVAVFNYCFDTLLAFPFLVFTLGINQYLAKVMITGTIVLWNFFIYKFWVFKKP